MPHDKLPKLLIEVIVTESEKKLNFFSARCRASKYYSSCMILHRENVSFKQHCVRALGECIQVEDELDRTNANTLRILDCLRLRPSSNNQLGHNLLHLQTNKIINRKRIFEVPVTTAIVN